MMASIRDKTAGEIVDLIERFLLHQCAYPQEWNDFVECSNRDPRLDSFRKRCEIVSSQFQTDKKSLDLNRDDRWRDATNELKEIAAELQLIAGEAER